MNHRASHYSTRAVLRQAPPLAWILAVALTTVSVYVSADCQRDADQAEAAFEARDLDALLSLDLRAKTRCSPDMQQYVSILAADLAAGLAQAAIARNDLAAAEAALRRAPTTSTWLVALSQGQIAEWRKDWGQAAKHYNAAYTLMLAPSTTQDRPDQDSINRVRNLAAKAVVLSDNLDAVISRGSGEGQGIYASKGYEVVPVEVVPAPVRFATNSDQLDAKGLQQAAQLASYVKTRDDARTLTLVGHADERGDDQYNLELSTRRAAALAVYLKEHGGVTLSITTEGQGERKPWPLADDSPPLTDAERWALDRRVELRFE